LANGIDIDHLQSPERNKLKTARQIIPADSRRFNVNTTPIVVISSSLCLDRTVRTCMQPNLLLAAVATTPKRTTYSNLCTCSVAVCSLDCSYIFRTIKGMSSRVLVCVLGSERDRRRASRTRVPCRRPTDLYSNMYVHPALKPHNGNCSQQRCDSTRARRGRKRWHLV
jgi:hypothetical protein